MTPERKAEYHKTIAMLRRCAERQVENDYAVVVSAIDTTGNFVVTSLPLDNFETAEEFPFISWRRGRKLPVIKVKLGKSKSRKNQGQ